MFTLGIKKPAQTGWLRMQHPADMAGLLVGKWLSGNCRDAPPDVPTPHLRSGKCPTYAAPPDMLVYHGNSQRTRKIRPYG